MAKLDEPEGAYIGKALQQLEAEMHLSRRELVSLLGVSYSHFSNLVTDQRPAGLPTIVKMARRTGRAVAFFLGDAESKTTIGALGLGGEVTMHTDEPQLPALVRVEEAAGPFLAGDVLHVEPSDWQAGAWALWRRGTHYSIVWMHERADLRLYTELDGRTHVYDTDDEGPIGVILRRTTDAPPPTGPILRGAEKTR